MRIFQFTCLFFLALIIVSCSQNNEYVNDHSENTTIGKSESNYSKNEKEPAIEESPAINTDSLKSPVVTIDSEQIEKIEPIKLNSIVFANPLPGLSAKIDLLKLPTEEEVGISSYPNAHVIQLDEKTEYRGKFYISMELVTPDNINDVLSYYKETDGKWHHTDSNGIHTFKMDKEKYFRETNTLQILPVNKILYEEVDSLLGYEANTLIRIYYEIDADGIVLEKLGLANPAPVNN